MRQHARCQTHRHPKIPRSPRKDAKSTARLSSRRRSPYLYPYAWAMHTARQPPRSDLSILCFVSYQRGCLPLSHVALLGAVHDAFFALMTPMTVLIFGPPSNPCIFSPWILSFLNCCRFHVGFARTPSIHFVFIHRFVLVPTTPNIKYCRYSFHVTVDP